ncbi:MAG: phage holin family protein [Gaiellaceae bacterium]
MTRAEWTYELPPVTGDSVWLEEYLVYDSSGEPGGKVFAVLEHHGRRWLGIERDHLPGRHDRRVVPFEAIRETDHENLAVHLALSARELDEALELDPAKGVEQGGTARRITRVPPAELPPRRDAGAPGPVDRGMAVAAPLGALFGMLALLAVFVFWGADNSSDALPYFAVPGVLFGVAALLAYRAWSRPWTRSAAAQTRVRPRR